MAALRLLAALLLLVVLSVDAKKKVARVKAGKNYNGHEPVHIVVNKVGYVNGRSTVQLFAVDFYVNVSVEVSVRPRHDGILLFGPFVFVTLSSLC